MPVIAFYGCFTFMGGSMMYRLIIPFALFDDQLAPVHILIHRIGPTDIVGR
jgi:hypothetical protein